MHCITTYNYKTEAQITIIISSAILALSLYSLFCHSISFSKEALFSPAVSFSLLGVSLTSFCIACVLLCKKNQKSLLAHKEFEETCNELEEIAQKKKPLPITEYFHHAGFHYRLYTVTESVRTLGNENQKARWADLLKRLHGLETDYSAVKLFVTLDTSFELKQLYAKQEFAFEIEEMDSAHESYKQLAAAYADSFGTDVGLSFNHLKRLKEKHAVRLFVAKDKNTRTILGGVTVVLNQEGTEAIVGNLCKRAHAAKIGMTQKMMHFVHENKKKLFPNVQKISVYIDVLTRNLSAKRLYEKLGFVEYTQDNEKIYLKQEFAF